MRLWEGRRTETRSCPRAPLYLTFPIRATRPNLWEEAERGGKGREGIKIQRNNFAVEFKWVDL